MAATLWVGVGAVCLAAGALAVALISLQGLRRGRLLHESLQSSFDALRREFEMLASISARTGRRVQRVEHEYSQVADRVDVVESRGPGAAAAGSLDQAIEWARRGAHPDKLAEQFGLSVGEAELVARLHGRQRSA